MHGSPIEIKPALPPVKENTFLIAFNFLVFKFYTFQELEDSHRNSELKKTKMTPKKESSLLEQRTKPKRRLSVT